MQQFKFDHNWKFKLQNTVCRLAECQQSNKLQINQILNDRFKEPSPSTTSASTSIHQQAKYSPPANQSTNEQSSGDLEELNTRELAQKISSELKRFSIPQAIFAQKVLCR